MVPLRLAVSRFSSRSSSSLHVGPGVHLRGCDSRPLESLRVSVLHSPGKGSVLSELFLARGATVTHLVREGHSIGNNYKTVDLSTKEGRASLISSLKHTDVFVDTTEDSHGLDPDNVVRASGHLIYARMKDKEEPFATMRALAHISCALYQREKSNCGQVLEISDSATAFKRMENVDQQ